ncbi:hypothetical protein NMY22_g16377 [Coprinellus aureogranulatus]|nr:hypothetical protein NMY22_g16377 [Coprinellus aureogranulatus]
MQADHIVTLLRTHSSVGPEDTQEIYRRGQYYESELAAWQKRLDAALVLVDVIQAKVDNLARKKNLYKSYTSPIQLLPAEVLSRAFADACAEDPDLDLFPLGRRSKVLTSHSLIHVCKFWRTVALQTRKVWHHSILLKPAGSQRSVNFQKRLWEVIELYGQNLTDLYVHLPGCEWPSFNSVRDAVLHTAPQLKSLKLVGNFFEGSDPIREVATPVLEHLLLSADSDDYELSSSVTFNAPNLTKLSIYCTPSSLTFLSMPWKQITYMSFGFPLFRGTDGRQTTLTWFPLHTVLDLLQHLSSLIGLHMTGVNIDYPLQSQPHDIRQVSLPHLVTLELNDYTCRVASVIARPPTPIHPCISLLAHLSTPSLQQFDWIIPASFQVPFFYSVQAINRFLQSAPRLISVRVAICDFHDAPKMARCHILRLAGTIADFAPLGGNTGWFSNGRAANIACQRRYTKYISPRMPSRFEDALITPVDHHIERFLEPHTTGLELVKKDFLWRPLEGGLEDPKDNMSLQSAYQVSGVVIAGLFGAETGPIDCERRLYIAI